jgi:hypothetical protein
LNADGRLVTVLLRLADDGDQILTLDTAESGTPDAERLARLASDATFAA